MTESHLRLVTVEVSNFKSFSKYANSESESHLVGPFTNFTGIIGPNGVGKSNIFDAIAYCLNMSLAPGKIRHARDLAHRLERINAETASNEAQSFEFFVKLNFIKTNLKSKKQEKLSI